MYITQNSFHRKNKRVGGRYSRKHSFLRLWNELGNHHGDTVNSQITQNLAEVWNWNSFGFCKAESQGLKASTNNSVYRIILPFQMLKLKCYNILNYQISHWIKILDGKLQVKPFCSFNRKYYLISLTVKKCKKEFFQVNWPPFSAPGHLYFLYNTFQRS